MVDGYLFGLGYRLYLLVLYSVFSLHLNFDGLRKWEKEHEGLGREGRNSIAGT
jgi:hypothetical protein